MLDGPFPHGGLRRGVSDGNQLLNGDVRVRALALARIAQTGSSTVRIPVDWSGVVAASPPAGFQARDPASTAYDFARLDAAVRSAAAAGLAPLLVVSHAPTFAEAPGRWAYAYPGSWAPSPAALEDFAAALASRYSGGFADPLVPGSLLPRVRFFQAWNEPNLPHYLEPQWIAQEGHWVAFSPQLYRQMLNAFYAGVKSAQPGALVVTAGLAPDGDPTGVGRMAPVSFLRSLLCLRSAAGRPAQSACTDPAHFDVLAFHPLSVGDPDRVARSAFDVAISDIAKVTALLARAERLGTILPAANKPVWVTELNWESAPQSSAGVVPGRQARWISRALHRLWIAGVSLVQWQFLIDPFPAVRAATPTGAAVEYPRPAGLYSAATDGDPEAAQPKAFLRGFTLPFDPLRLDRHHIRVWALMESAGEGAELQRRGGVGGWRIMVHLHADSHGVINVPLVFGGAGVLRLRSARGLLTAPATAVHLTTSERRIFKH